MRNFAKMAAAVILTLSTGALAEQRATTEEAKALAIKAVEHIKSAGAENAYKEFTEKAAGWADRDLYVFVLRKDGTIVAHGGIPVLVGKNLIALKDVDGKPFIAEMMAFKDPGWEDYKWKNPQSGAVEAKTTYIIPVAETVVGVGAYK
jgi:cytochrome c